MTELPPPAVQPPKPETGLRHVWASWLRFLRLPHHAVFLRSFAALMLLAGLYAVHSINDAVNDLEAEGNPFAGLVWNALPPRLINDAIVVAIVAAVITLVGAGVKSRRCVS